MNRAFTVAGSVTSGATTCYTISKSSADASKNGIGSKTSGAAVAGTYYAGIPTGTSHGDVMNSTTAGDGTEQTQQQEQLMLVMLFLSIEKHFRNHLLWKLEKFQQLKLLLEHQQHWDI